MPPQQEQPIEPPKKKSGMPQMGWWLLLGFTVCIDLIEIGLDMFGIGLIANRYLDIGYGMFLPFVLAMSGVPLDMKTIVLIAGSFIAEEIPVLDAAPFWTFDVWKIKQWNT